MENSYDIQAIMRFLPHRYPFILIDRVIKLVSGEEIVALKNVTINEPFFQGHFPGNPVMPGVLIVEFMAQVAAVLLIPVWGNSIKMNSFLTAGCSTSCPWIRSNSEGRLSRETSSAER